MNGPHIKYLSDCIRYCTDLYKPDSLPYTEAPKMKSFIRSEHKWIWRVSYPTQSSSRNVIDRPNKERAERFEYGTGQSEFVHTKKCLVVCHLRSFPLFAWFGEPREENVGRKLMFSMHGLPKERHRYPVVHRSSVARNGANIWMSDLALIPPPNLWVCINLTRGFFSGYSGFPNL